MGVFYNSICIPGDRRDEVRRSLERWLHGRGFELSVQPMLFDLDGEAERSSFVIWNRRWTIVVYSKYEEERRLIHELQAGASPILYLWVQDSDVWGYDLFDDGGIAGSFNSDPRTYRSFAGSGFPGEDRGRPAADPDEVCRRLGFPDLGPELRLVQRRKALFKEEVCAEACRLLGVEAAAVSYDDLERRTAALAPGWRSQQLLFFHRRSLSPPSCATDLHRVDIGELAAGAAPGGPGTAITPKLLAEVEQMRRRAELRLLILKPVSWLAVAWRWSRERLATPRSGPRRRPDPDPPGEAAGGAGGERELDNPRHRCRITLAAGARPTVMSGRPATVYAFRVGDTPVTCTARRRWRIAEILRPPGRSRVIRDERFHTRSGLKARHLLFELPARYTAGAVDPSFLALHVVETPSALYVFLYRFAHRILPEVDEAVRTTVTSFRLLES